MLALGVDALAMPLLPDLHGAVRWPAGTIGSITHVEGWTGAVAACRAGWGGVSSIGLDAEIAVPLAPEVLAVVASGRELDVVTALTAQEPHTPWSTVLFAAKEAAYKAWYPITGEVVGHDRVRVTLSGDRFTATLVSDDHRPMGVRGRWALGASGADAVVALGVIRSGRRPLALAVRAAGADRQGWELPTS